METSKVNLKIHKGDMVEIIAGREKGKTGKVLRVLPESRRIVVEKLNLIKRHTRPAAGQTGEHHKLGDDVEPDHALADGMRNRGAEQEGSDKIEESGPENGNRGRQHARGNDGRDAVGRIVEAIEEIKEQRRQDCDTDQYECCIHLCTFPLALNSG